jgi:hypothetical protein
MGANALFDLLPDFGARPARVEPASSARPMRPVPEPPPAVDVDALIAAAVTRAEAELSARLGAAHQAEREAESEAHAAETKALLASLGDDLGRTIGAHLEALEGRVTDLVGSQAARILGTLLADDLQQRSLVALASTVRETIGDAEAVRVRVSGPLSLYETLREALGPRGKNLDFVEAPGFDLTVTIDDAVFETRMAEWSQALSEILS